MKEAVNQNTEDYTRNPIYISIILAKDYISKMVYVGSQPPLSWLKQIIPPNTLYTKRQETIQWYQSGGMGAAGRGGEEVMFIKYQDFE